ncbi:hypothetical protein OGAPHI_002058 [Ogataea philodendri]|uniref:Uncharacterized protein n=1 Tax=Ogataea philodendri TaxID=1378263 RepID=A0A9P8PBA1_9ASCO|nr:uncharacterized protein OGAPHI_002058 [Ogataea philodendri]KAH3668304.1 hypothetical protein OGAPHI_002058 [Ogataea philodendri]
MGSSDRALLPEDSEVLGILTDYLVRKNQKYNQLQNFPGSGGKGDRDPLETKVEQQAAEIVKLRSKCSQLEERLRRYEHNSPEISVVFSPRKRTRLSPLKAEQSPTYSSLSGTETEDSAFSTPHKLRLVNVLTKSAQPEKLVSDSDGEYDDESRKVLKQSGSQQPRDKIRSLQDEELVDLTIHPVRKGNWWPEDFKPNPETNFGEKEPFKMRMINPKYAHPALQTQLKYQQKHLQEEAMKGFNRLAGKVEPSTPGVKLVWNSPAAGALPTPLKTPEQALDDPNIDPVFKFEINRNNYKNFGLNLNSNKLKLWLDLQDSPPGHERSEFPTPSQTAADREKSLKRSKLIALQRLFQTVFMIQPTKDDNASYQQVGKFIFRNEEWNQLVRQNKFQIDQTIFYHFE